MNGSSDMRLNAPATLRNRDPILEVLRRTLPASGLVLEVASGSGEHIVHFAAHLPDLEWQPSDPESSARRSITDWTAHASLANIRPPLDIDVRARPWPVDTVDAILCINMIHISPWAATEALLAESGRLLPPGRPLYLYGPYRESDRAFAPSNVAFDADLKRRNPESGIRSLDYVATVANSVGLVLHDVIAMPANNLSAIFIKR